MKKKRKTMDLSTFAFCALIILSMLFVVSNYLASGLLAKYLSENSSSDDARVAKWEINFDDSYELNSTLSPEYLEYGSHGEWLLNIENSSEVSAILSDSSNIHLKLYSNKFDLDHEHTKWDFLHDNNMNVIDNPLNFQIYLYNCDIETLQNHYMVDGVFNNTVQQTGLNVQQLTLLDTQTSNISFKFVIENGMVCYDGLINVGVLSEDYILAYEEGKCCIRVVWSVANLVSPDKIDGKFTAYTLIDPINFDVNKHNGIINKTTSEEIKIKGQSLSDSQIQTLLTNNTYTFITENSETEKYVIVYEEKDIFDYLIFTSSLGGEVMITLEDTNGVYTKKSSKLTSDELTILNNRTINSIATYTDLTKYIEKLNYKVFINDYTYAREQYESDSGYLGLGLRCKIELNLRVEQVD